MSRDGYRSCVGVYRILVEHSKEWSIWKVGDGRETVAEIVLIEGVENRRGEEELVGVAIK